MSRKFYFASILIFLLFVNAVFGQNINYYQSFIIVNSGSGNTYYDARVATYDAGVATSNADLNGVNFNNYNSSSPIIVTTQPTSSTICYGNNVTLSAAANGADTYYWQEEISAGSWINISGASASMNIAGETVFFTISNLLVTKTIRCRFSNDGGLNEQFSNSAIITPQRPTITVQPVSAFDCEDNVVNFYVGATNVDFQWQRKRVSDSGFLDITDATPTDVSGTTTNYLRIDKAGSTNNLDGTLYRCKITDKTTLTCTNMSNNVSLSINAFNTNTVTTSPICLGKSITFTSNIVSGASRLQSYQWYKKNITTGAIIGANSASYSTVISSVTDNVWGVQGVFQSNRTTSLGVTSNMTCIVSKNSSITVRALPTTPTANSVSRCGAGVVTLSASSTLGTNESFRWYESNTSTSVLGTNTSYTTTFLAVGIYTYYLSVYNTNTCESVRTPVTVTVNALPTITLGSVADICNSVTTFNLPFSATTDTPNEYSILVGSPSVSGFSTVTNVTLGSSPISVSVPVNTPANTYQFSMTVKNTTTTCISAAQNFTVKINDTPLAPSVTSPINYCQNLSTVALPAIPASSNSLLWYGTSAIGGTSSVTAPTPSSASVGTTTYYVSQKNTDNCESPRNSISVLVNANPTAPTTPATVNYCKNTSATALSATVSGSNTLIWYDANDNILASAPTPSTSMVGTQTFKVSQKTPSPANCEGPKAVVTVTIFDNPLAPIVTPFIGYCQNATAIALSATATVGNSLLWYGTSLTGGTSSATAPTPLTTSAGTTSYYVSQKDANNCESPRAKIDVEITPTLTGTVSGTNAFCITGVLNNSTTLTTNPTGGNGTFAYQWQNLGGNIASANAQTYIASSVSTYKVIITSGYCIASTSTLNVTAQGWNDTPSITGNTPDVCGSGSKTLSIVSPNASGTYKWFADATTLSPTSSGTTFSTPTLLAATTYYVAREQVITGSLSCQTNRTALTINVVTIQPTPTIINSANKTSFCNSESSFTLAVSCSSGSGQYRLNSGSWIVGNSVSINPATYSSSVTFTYDFKCVVSATCESSTASTSITINPIFAAPTISGTTSICAGNATILTASGCSGIVIWSNGISASSITISSSGTYNAICTANSCVSAVSNLHTIVVNARPIAPLITSDDADNIVCQGINVILTASNCSGTVIWSNGVSANSITVSLSGTYTATCTVNGCVSPASTLQTIVVNTIPTAPTINSNDTDNVVCQGTNVVLTASNCSGTVIWSNGVSANSITISSSGTYTANCTVNGCVSSASTLQTIVVNTIPTAPTINSNDADNTVCQGTNVILTVNNCLGTVIWSNGVSVNSITILSSSTYTANCTVNGCVSPASTLQTIVVNALPTIGSQPTDKTVCKGNTVHFIVSATNATSYQWQRKKPSDATFLDVDDSMTGISGAASNDLKLTSVGTQNPDQSLYKCIITSNGCSVTSSQVLLSVNDFTGTLASQTKCENGLVTFSVPASVGTITSYQWQQRPGTTGTWNDISNTGGKYAGATSNSLIVSSLSNADAVYYRCTVVFSTVIGTCNLPTDDAKLTVTTIPPPTVSGATAICSGSSTTLTANGCSGTVTWSTGAIGNTLSASSSGTYSATCTQSSCTSVASNIHSLAVNAIPIAPIITSDDADNIVCQGTNVILTASNCSGTVIWSNGVSASSITISSSGTYTTTCTVNGCVSTVSSLQTIIVNAIPIAPSISGNMSICAGSSTVLTASGCSGTITWSTGATGNTLSVSSSGTYTATCTVNGCVSQISSSKIITVNSIPATPIITGNLTICQGGNTTLTASTCAGIITWSTGATGSTLNVSSLGNYTAICTQNSCTSPTSQIHLITESPSPSIILGAINNICNVATTFDLSYSATTNNPDKYSLSSVMPDFVALNEVNLSNSPIPITIPSGKIGMYTFTLSIKNSTTTCVNSQTFNVTILPILSAGIIETSPSTTNCAGYNGLSISSVSLASGGKSVYIYQWQSSIDGTNFTDISGANLTTYDPDILNQTTYFRRKVSDGCGDIKYSNIHQITIVPDPQITLTDASEKTICSGNNITLEASISGGFGICSPSWQSSDSPTSGFVTEQNGGISFTKTLTNATSTSIIKYFRVIYACSGTGSGSCNQATSAVVKVIINPPPSVPTISGVSTICLGTSTTLTASGCNGNILWSNGATSTNIIVSVAGTYTVTCTNFCGTSAASNEIVVNITMTNPPTLAGTTSICSGQIVTLTASECAGNIVWNNGSSGTSISVNPSITTSYTTTCIANGCTSITSNSVTVTVAPTIDFTIGAMADLCSSAMSFSLPYTLTLGSPNNYSLTSTIPSFVAITDANLPVSPLTVNIPNGQTGTFSFTLTLKIVATGCSKSQTFNVTILPVLSAGTIETSPSTTNCAGYNGLSISSIGLASGGKSVYIYQWQSSIDGTSFTDISGANLTTYDPDILNQTTYFRRKVSDVCGDIKYSNIHQITIVPDPQITLTDASEKTICSGNNITLEASISGGFGICSPSWQSSDSPTSGFVTEQNGGISFTKTLTNATSTSIIKYFRVIYACSGTGSGSCNQATSAVVKVIINPPPSVPTISGVSTICLGTSTTLTASGCNGNILWSNGATSTNIIVSVAGTYTVTCTNFCGTSAASNEIVVNITMTNPPTLAGTTSICSGQIVTLTASECAGNIVWNNGSSGTSISVNPSITTSYTTTCIANGCTSITSNSVTVTVAPTIDFTIGAMADLCSSAMSFSLPYTLTLGSPNNYSLTSTIPSFVAITDANLPVSPLTVNIPNGQTGTFSFTLTLKIVATGCSKSQTFNVTILPVLSAGTIETSPSTTNCAGYNGLSISSIGLASGGKSVYIYQWQSSIDGTSFTDISGANLTTYDPDILNQTTYFRRKVSDVCGDIKYSNIHQITIVPDPQITLIDASEKAICSGNSITLEATLSGGFGICSPSWQSSDSPTSGFVTEQNGGISFTKTLTNATSTSIIKYFRVIYACSGTGSGSCNQATSAVVKVTVNYIPTAPTITPASVVICPTQSITLTASACSGAVTWSGGQTGSTLLVSSSGSYNANCTVNNCVSTASLQAVVTVASGGLPVPPPIISGATSICNGQSTNLTATGCTGLVTWSNGNTGTSISVSPLLSSNYSATCNDGSCTSNISNPITVIVNNYPAISTEPKNEADCNGNSVTFSVSASPATAYQWQRKIPNGSFIDISNAITNSLTISNVGSATDPNLTQYQVVVSNNTCSVTSNAAVLTVNSITGNLADQTICEGANISFDLTNITSTGTIQSYQWQKRIGTSGPWNDILGAITRTLTINAATNADEQYYRCKINFTVGSSTCARYTTEQDANGAKLTVLVASIPSISGTNAICLGKSTTLMANSCDGTISWSSGQSTSTITVLPTVTTSYSVTCTSAQCNFMIRSAPYSVVVNATPQPESITYDVVFPATLVFSAKTNVPNGILTWYNKATGGTATTTAPFFTALGTYSYWLTQTDPLTGCESARMPVIAKVLDYFHLTQQPNAQVDCKGNSVYMNVTAAAPNSTFTYQWQRKRPNEVDFTNLIQDGNGIKGWYAKTMLVSNVGDDDNPSLSQYRCIVSSNGQSLTSDAGTLIVNSVIGSLPNLGTCVGGNTNFNLPNYFTITGNVMNYQWQIRLGTSGVWTDLVDANGISGSSTNNLKFTNVRYEQGINYRCLVKFNTQGFECTEPTDAAQLIVSGFPSAPSVSDIFYCQFSTAAKLKVNSAVQNLVWFAEATGGSGSTIVPIPSTAIAGTFSYYVADRTDQGCESPRAEIKVNIGALPPAPINTTPSAVNEGEILTFSADGSPKEGQVLHWFTSPTGTAFTTNAPIFTATGTYTRYVAQLSAFGCLGSRTPIVASITPVLKFTKQPISQTDCDGNVVTFSIAATGLNAISYQWQRQKTNETLFTNILNETANSLKISNIGDVENPHLTKYRCIIKDEKSITISEEAILTVNEIKGTLANINLCDGKIAKLSFNSLTLMGKVVSYQWQKKEGNIYTDMLTNQEGIANVNEVGTFRGRVTFAIDSKTTCVRNTDDLKIEIKPVPTAPQVANQAICQNVAFNLEKSVTASNTLLWYNAATDTTGDKNAPKVDVSKIGKTTFYVSQITQFGCESKRNAFDLIISPIPAKPLVSDLNLCRNAPSTALIATTEMENQLIWYASLTAKDAFIKTPIPDTKFDAVTTYFVNAKNVATCESERVTVKVSVALCIATFENNFNNCLQVAADSIKGNKWYDLYDNAGRLYASVNPNGLNLGKVAISIRHYGRGSAAIPATQNDTKFMARYLDFQSSLLKNFEKPVSLRIYYQNAELNEYKTATNVPNLTINDFNIVHYDGVQEDCGFENNDNFNEGNSVVIYKNVVGNQIAKDFFFLQFDVNEFSENGATANNFTEVTFTAKETQERTVKLNWQTKFEVRAVKFILERSVDCHQWISLGEIKANSISSNYERFDSQPLSGKSCYRLIYIDKDGTKKYLDPIEVNFNDNTPICSVFPNPWTIGDEVNLYFRNIKEKEIKLYDLVGQQYSFTWKKDELGIIHIRPDTYLTKGTHFVVIIGEDGKPCMQKVVINP